MNFKRLISACLASILACAVLSGCSNEVKTKGSAFNKHIKYTINVLNAEKHGKDEAFKYMTNKFNIEFEFIPITFADWGEKVRIWVAAGDMPDIMWVDLQSANFKEFLSWVKQGVIRDIPPLEKDYPNLQKFADKLKSDEYFKVDGKLYAWPSYSNNDITGKNALNSFFYRRDWAEKLGIAKDGDEYTWDEFINLAKAFIEKDPGGNGPGKTIGLGTTDWAFPQAFGIMQNSPNWDTYFIKDGRYVWGMEQPETLTGIKTVKKLYDDGIIWKDHILAKSNDANNKFMAGELGILFGGWTVSSVENRRKNIAKSNPSIDVDKVVVPMYVRSPDGKILTQTGMDYWSATVFNKKMDDEKMERIMKVFDWIASDEGYEYSTKGVKGVDWDDKDGKITLREQDPNKADHILTDMVRSTYPFTFEDPRVSKSAKNTVLSMADRLKKDDVYVRNLDLDVLFFSAPNKDKYGVLFEEGRDKIKQIITSSKDVEKDWNEWLKSVEPKVTPVVEELNTILLKQKQQKQNQ